MAGSVCAVGCFARTGKAAVVAVGPGPVLVAKWDVALVPETQERFVFHAAQLMGAGKEATAFVKKSTKVVTRHTAAVVGALIGDLAGNGVDVMGAAVVGHEVEMPAPLDKILTSHALLHTAEGALFRGALVDAFADAGIACTLVAKDELGDADVALAPFGKVPSPWRKEHKDAALAALTLVRASGRGSVPRTARAAPPRPRA